MATVRSAHQPVLDACASGQMCASHEAGHGLSVLRNRLASATSRGWRDGLVVSVQSGRARVALWDGSELEVHHHVTLADDVRVGDPVAVHPLYEVLAAGQQRWSVQVVR